jgi:hypothetical protein
VAVGVTALRRTLYETPAAHGRRWFWPGRPSRGKSSWAAQAGDDRLRRFDCAEVVVQIFDTPYPVGGAEADFAADAGNPAEVISRCPWRC